MSPKSISIETTNNCNNQCLICPHGHNLIKDKGYMERDVFYGIIDKLVPYRDSAVVELHGVGEPLLHPYLPDFISYCTAKGFYTSICTNAILLTEKVGRRIIDSGLKKMVVSIETKENYERIRCTNIYSKVLENIQNMARMSSDLEVEIYMITLGNESSDDFQAFKEQFDRDRVTFSDFRASDWCGKIPFEGLSLKKGAHVRKTVCPLFKDYVSIDFQGRIRHCYLDFNSEILYGDLTQTDFDALWRSDKRLAVMAKMADGLYRELTPCSECVFPYVDNKGEIDAEYSDDAGENRPEMQLLSKIKQKKRETEHE